MPIGSQARVFRIALVFVGQGDQASEIAGIVIPFAQFLATLQYKVCFVAPALSCYNKSSPTILLRPIIDTTVMVFRLVGAAGELFLIIGVSVKYNRQQRSKR